MALKSQTEIKKALKQILKERDELKAQAKKRGCEFVSLSPQQLTRKLRGETSNSPFFTAQAWDQFASPGSPCFFLANYTNPDPQVRLCFVTIFFGLTNLVPDVASALAARDSAWPYLSTELTIVSPGETGVANFTYPVPFGPKGTYIGNALLWAWAIGGDIGVVFDRATPFYVTLK
jgi:hypothetical protein